MKKVNRITRRSDTDIDGSIILLPRRDSQQCERVAGDYRQFARTEFSSRHDLEASQ